MTEEERIFRGELFASEEPELVEKKRRAHRLSQKYNETFEDDAEVREAILRELLGELGDCVPTPRGTEKALEDQEIAALISDFLRRLSKEHRAIFLRRYWYGQSVAEIAEALGCGQGKVKSALFRTRKALRTYLEQEEVLL